MRNRQMQVRSESPPPAARLRTRELANLWFLMPPLLAAAIYSGTVHIPVVYDDHWTIARDTSHLGWLDLMLSPRGLTYVTHRFDQWLWGSWLPGRHIMNILLHSLATAGATWVSLLICRHAHVAIVSGLLFAVHPVHVEAVASIAYRKDPLAMVFASLAFVGWTYSRQRAALYPVALACLGLGLLAKEAAVIGIVPVLLLTDVLALRRPASRQNIRWSLLRCASLIVGLVLVSVLWLPSPRECFSAAWIQEHVDAGLDHYGQVLATVLASATEQLRLLVIPVTLSPHYPEALQVSCFAPEPLLGAIVLLCVGAVSFIAALRSRAAGLAAFWTISSFIPVSNVVPLTFFFVADRYLYVPSLGVCVSGALMFEHLRRRAAHCPHHAARAVVMLPAVVISLFAIRTVDRTFDWRSESALWLASIQQGIVTPSILANYGSALSDEGRLEEAELQLKRAITVGPTHARAHLNLGVVQLRRGRVDDALVMFRRAITLNPKVEYGHYNLGVALAASGRHHQAIEAFRHAVELDPDDRETRLQLSLALIDLDRHDEAAAQLLLAIPAAGPSVELCAAVGRLRADTTAASDIRRICASAPGW